MSDQERADISDRLIRIETLIETGNKSLDEYKTNMAVSYARTDAKADKAHSRIDALAADQTRMFGIGAGILCVTAVVAMILKLTGKI